MQGNDIPTPEQNITSVRWYVSHCRVLRHPTKGNMAHGETSGPAATDPGSSSCTCRLLRSHIDFHNSVGVVQATHRVLRCTHDSREARLSAVLATVPVTALASPVCLYLGMRYVASALRPLQHEQLLYLSNQTNLSKHLFALRVPSWSRPSKQSVCNTSLSCDTNPGRREEAP